MTLASGIASAITDSTPDVEVALFVPYVFIESTMSVVGGKLSVGAEVSRLLVCFLFRLLSCGKCRGCLFSCIHIYIIPMLLFEFSRYDIHLCGCIGRLSP